MFKKLSQKVTEVYQAAKQRVKAAVSRAQGWLKAHRRGLLIAGTGLLIGLTGLVGLLLWRRSPAFRAAFLSAAAFVAASLVLKPIAVEAPTLTPVEPSPDGQGEAELVF
jgi:hypothetical protein